MPSSSAGAGPRRASAAHVFVDALSERPEISDADHHHLSRVLRLRGGEVVTVTDGAGRWRQCSWEADGLVASGPEMCDPSPRPLVTVGFALTKADKPELVVQKLTEAGVDRIVPFRAERSIVRWDAGKADRNLARFRAVAREAAAQSRRVWLPQVDDIADFDMIAGVAGAAMADCDGPAIPDGLATILVGPEGGWSSGELASGLPVVGFGPGVLRAETAAVAAGVLLCALRAGLIAPGKLSV